MTNVPIPFQMGFEMQRQSIKATQQLFERGLDMQKKMTETTLENSFAAQRSAQNWGVELTHEMTNTQFEAFESVADDMEREVRSAMDDQFKRNANTIQQVLNDQFELGADFIQGLLNAQLDEFQSALESGGLDGQSMIDKQFKAFDDSRDILWNEFEPEFIKAAEQLTEQQRVLVEESTDALLDAQQDVAEQTFNDVQLVQEST